MMENSKVKTMAEENTYNTFGEQSCILSPMTLYPIESTKWLDSECPVINQSDFDTCGNSYSDGDYQVRHLNGYDREFRTYMNQFEN